MKKILIISLLLISSPLFSGHHARGEMSNTEIVKKAYATFGSGDIDGWKKLHASDLKFSSGRNEPCSLAVCNILKKPLAA